MALGRRRAFVSGRNQDAMKTLRPITFLVLAGGALALGAVPVQADGAAANDNLNATLWTQSSVEFKANALGMYKLAELMLDRALADKSWTAAPVEQTGDYQDKPPAVMLDVDETVLDNSFYQAWMVLNDEHFGSKTWVPFVRSELSLAVPGSLEFINYANSKGVKVFYVTNRKAPQEDATRNNLKALGYPIDESEDTVLLKGEKEDWGSKKGSRRTVITQNYRLVMVVGDNFGDFVDGYKGSREERHALAEANKDMWGSKWIVIANPTYGSWESAAFDHDYKNSGDQQRQMKRDDLSGWQPK
jgi:acid phosphatase